MGQEEVLSINWTYCLSYVCWAVGTKKKAYGRFEWSEGKSEERSKKAIYHYRKFLGFPLFCSKVF